MIQKNGLLNLREHSAEEIRSFLMPLLNTDNAMKPQAGQNLVGGLIFFEASTRTRVSFERAGLCHGIRWIHWQPEGSSVQKGESLRESFETLNRYDFDFYVLRHPQFAAAHWLYEWTSKPVINAGEGAHEHPTQALGDALCLLEVDAKKIWKIAFYGDLIKSRVARSAIGLFKKLGWSVSLVNTGDSELSLFAKAFACPVISPNELKEFEIIYVLRTQKERGGSAPQEPLRRHWLKPDVRVMHAGPVVQGEDLEWDLCRFDDRHSLIHQQVRACYRVRVALLGELVKTLRTERR